MQKLESISLKKLTSIMRKIKISENNKLLYGTKRTKTG
jgi:hypothetical protein